MLKKKGLSIRVKRVNLWVKRIDPIMTRLLTGQPFYDPNPFNLNPNSLTSCRVRGLCRKLPALLIHN
jgi:hypothetical protein